MFNSSSLNKKLKKAWERFSSKKLRRFRIRKKKRIEKIVNNSEKQGINYGFSKGRVRQSEW